MSPEFKISVDDITSTKPDVMYAKTQKIGEWAKENGYDGILAPSARDNGGSNIIMLNQ